MVNAEKHKKASKPGNDSAPYVYNGIDVTDTELSPDEIEKLAKRCCWFYSCDTLGKSPPPGGESLPARGRISD